MKIGVPKEVYAGENRVALIPDAVRDLEKVGASILVQSGAGVASGHSDQDYQSAGATIVNSREEVFGQADIIVAVRLAGASPESCDSDPALLNADKTVFAMMEPLFLAEQMKPLAESGATVFAMELIPRITRAQSMDVLSSMASIAGYKAVLMAADQLPRMFPMMMTAAGTIKPARVLVVGAGVAGLQAIATAKRLGAIVSAYDVRPAVKEQVESLGGKFVELEIDTEGAEDAGGYAREQTEDQIRQQQELMAEVVAESNAVITTAAIPGRKSPVIVTADMVKRMAPGSVIIDLAAERGGNCELTKLGEVVDADGVTILGPDNLATTVAVHASQMYSKNMVTLLKHLIDEGKLKIDMDDEITAGTLVGKGGEVLHPMVRDQLGLEPAAQPAADEAADDGDAADEAAPEGDS